MKPQRIFLIRHGESTGNVDKNIYKHTPDYALTLTSKGILQAEQAASAIRDIVGNGTVAAYYSPFFRTRQTADIILRSLNYNPTLVVEDPRLREQEWCGKLRENGFMHEAEAERDAYGHFYYRFDGGESCADVFDRISSQLNTVFRDFEKANFSQNCLFFTHGMTMRLILMRWLHLSVEEFEMLANPANCEFWQLDYQPNERYKLVTPVRKYDQPRHNFQYPYEGITKRASAKRLV